MESETKENNLSLSQDEEDVNLKNDTKHDVNNIIKLEEDKIINETETVDKESHEKLLLLYEFVTSDEFLENVRERAKDKSLHIASALGKLDMVEKLLEMGHDINMKNNEYKTPLYFAVENNHLSIVKILIENNAFINAKDKVNGFTPLHIAVQNNNLDIVKILVENNAFIDAQDKVKGFTPLHIPVQKNNLDIVKILVENDAFIDAQDKVKGFTPLHIAVQNNNLDIVKILVENNAFIDAQDKDNGFTPLHIAVKTANLTIVKFLVEENAFIGVQDDECWWTPLHWAIRNNNTEIVEYLCSLKDTSHLRSKDNYGRTSLDLARYWSKPECIKIIENRLKF